MSESLGRGKVIATVRAWAEYDDYRVFYDTGQAIDCFQWYPRGRVGDPSSISHGVTGGLLDALRRFTGRYVKDAGPLRSLCVLFSNGAEVHMKTQGLQGYREVKLCDRNGAALSWGDGYDTRRGWQVPDDVEAVERVLTDVVAWFTGGESDGLETDGLR